MDQELKERLDEERARTLLEVKNICETFAHVWSIQGGTAEADGANRIKQWIEVALSAKP